MRRIFRDTLGKWHVQEFNELKKAWVNSESESTPAKQLKEHKPNLAQGLYGKLSHSADPELMKKIKQSFDSMHDARAAGSERGAAHHLGVIHGLIHGSKEGDVHLGDLSDMAKDSERNRIGHGLGDNTPRFGNRDLAGAFDKHIGGDVNNLADLHDKFGEGAVRGIARAHGVNVDPYSSIPLSSHKNLASKPHLMGDTQAFVYGHYGQHKTSDTPDANNSFFSPDESSKNDIKIDPKISHRIEEAYPDSLNHLMEDYEDAPDDYSEEEIKQHYAGKEKDFEDAINDRGMDTFKQAHKIK